METLFQIWPQFSWLIHSITAFIGFVSFLVGLIGLLPSYKKRKDKEISSKLVLFYLVPSLFIFIPSALFLLSEMNYIQWGSALLFYPILHDVAFIGIGSGILLVYLTLGNHLKEVNS